MSKLRIAFHKNRTFLLWFTSYIVVLLVPVVIYFALYYNVNTTAKAEVERANGMMLSQFLNFLDDSLSEFEHAASSIYNDTKIQSLMYKTKPLSPSSIYKIVDIQKDLRNFRLSNTNISNIYVYCKRSDMLVSITDSISRVETKNIYDQLTGMDYDQWEQALQNTALPTYQIFKQQSAGSQREFDKLTYCRPFPFAYTENMAGMVIISIDVEQLRQKFLKSSYNMRDQYFIIDRNGGVFALNQDPAIAQSIDFTPLYSSDDGLNQGLIDLPGYTCLSMKSQVNDWIYVRLVDTTEVNKRIHNMNITFVVCIGISLLVGTVIAFLLTRHNYNPLQHLKRVLGGNREELPVQRESDFQYIIRQVQKLQLEKDSMKHELDIHLDVVRDVLLLRIIKGELYAAELDKACDMQGISPDSMLAVVLAALDESSSGQKLSSEQQTILVTNLFTKVFHRNHLRGSVTEVDTGMVACLVVLDSADSADTLLDELRAGINEAGAILSATQVEAAITIAYSCVHRGICQAHAAYLEAHEALEYSWLTGSRGPQDYGRIKGRPSASGYMQQALQHDHHFINCIRAMDFNGARRSLNEIIDTELSGGDYSLRMSRFRMYGLISMLIGAVGELGNVFGNAFFDSQLYIQRLSQCHTVQELRSLINELLDKASRLSEEQSRTTVQNGIKEAKEFIERNYMDPNLTVAMVAGAMGLNPSYLTQLIKRETGHNTMDFIHLTRLKAAKEYLKEYKIKDVAGKVGYYDVRTLIRAFRKYEGITPGKFKELDIAQNSEEFAQELMPDPQRKRIAQ